MEAAQELFKLGDTEAGISAIYAIIDLATGYGIDLGIDPVEYRMEAARKIAKLGDSEAATNVLMVLVENEDGRFDASDRMEAARMITELANDYGTEAVQEIVKLRAINALTSLAEEDFDDDYVRMEVAQEIAKLGDTAAAINAFTALVQDDWFDERLRMRAAQEIAKLGDTAAAVNAFTALAQDGFINDDLRVEASREIAKLGDSVSAIMAYANMVEQAIVKFVAAYDPLEAAQKSANLYDRVSEIMAYTNLPADDIFVVEYSQRMERQALRRLETAREALQKLLKML